MKSLITESLRELSRQDKKIFSMPSNEDIPELGRILHEVCINHRFAYYLEKNINHLLAQTQNSTENEKIYVDIEFNRRGSEQKKADVSEVYKKVRPDIIIHNRKDGEEKKNILVVEAKKDSVSDDDINKVKGLMKDDKFKYKFGLTVSYCQSDNHITATLYTLDANNNFRTENIVVNNST